MNALRIALLSLLLGTGASAPAQTVYLRFSGIRSPKGQIIVKVYTDDKGFEDNKPIKTVKFTKRSAGTMAATIDLEPGTYGLALLDDEDGNTKMEYNMIGMPKEGFGFSDFYLTGLKKPKFDQFKFTLSPNQKKNIEMKIRYL
jgi:uncharacterized protein (DUF2141 family)